jgi:hypothetical protein
MKKTKAHASKNFATPGKPTSDIEFESMIKSAEDGPFKLHGSHNDFKKDILSVWRKKHGE